MNNKLLNIINEEIEFLNENVEGITVDNDFYSFRDSSINTYAFSVYEDNLLVSPKNGTHGDAIINTFNIKFPQDEEIFYKIKKKTKFWGRIWLDNDIITFWDDYIPENVINNIKNMLQKYFSHKNINNFKVELD
ncbi:MAG: hypothetical protein WC428_00885 [Candidatus Paceibacterota bacterium]